MFKNNQIRSLFTVSASKAGVAIFSLVTAAVFANVYGQAGLGIFALLRVAPAVFMVLTDPGFSHAVPYLCSNKKIAQSTVIGSSIYVYLIVTAVQVGLWVLIAPLVQQHLLTPLPISAVYAAAALAPMQSITILLVNLLRASYRYNLANGVFLVAEITLLLLVVVSALWLEHDLSILVYLLIFASTISLLSAIGFLVVTKARASLRFNRSVILEGIKFGIKSQIGNAFQILNYRLDHLLLGFFLTPEKVAVYFVATKSVEFFRFFTASIVFVFEPIFAAQGKTDARTRVRKMFAPLLAANFCLLAIGVTLAPFIYPIVFGDWSGEAAMPLMVLAVGLTISGGNSLFGAYFLGQGQPGVTTIASLAGVVTTIALALVLIPAFGVIGAAVTSSVTYSIVTLAYVVFFLRRTSSVPKEMP